MKKYIEKDGDITRFDYFKNQLTYGRVVRNLKSEAYCNIDYCPEHGVTFKKGEKYRVLKAYRIINVNSEGYIDFESVYVSLLSNENIEYFILESSIIGIENKITYGKHLLIEKLREIK
jgi:hypothetical protein